MRYTDNEGSPIHIHVARGWICFVRSVLFLHNIFNIDWSTALDGSSENHIIHIKINYYIPIVAIYFSVVINYCVTYIIGSLRLFKLKFIDTNHPQHQFSDAMELCTV